MRSLYQDTIVAPATIPGTGAISIIRVSGPDCISMVSSLVRLSSGDLSSAKGYTVHFGRVFNADGSLLDEVLVTVFRAPHSYTGEDAAEISCHASSYIASELIHLLTKAGARYAEPGEFTRRAFLNGKMDLAQAEAVADVIASETSASHRVAMNQLRGHYSQKLEALKAELTDMASLLELELDFSEEDVEFAQREQLISLVKSTLEHVDSLASSFRLGNIIKKGVPVAIVGPPNAGKSTLLNSLVGEERAIVSDIAGTTRDTIEETVNIDGILFRFIDTAGIRESGDTIEQLGIQRSLAKISEASIIIGLLDSISSADALIKSCSQLCSQIDFGAQTLIIALNKLDLAGPERVNKNVSIINNVVNSHGYKAVITSLQASSADSVETLKKLMKSAVPDVFNTLDASFVTNERHYNALCESSNALKAVLKSLTSGIPTELIAEDLRSAISSISSILGHDLQDHDTILHTIFSRHCIGK